MRSIFCGNLEFDARQSDVERLFRRYGRVDRVDMKSGFAFIYMEDERDAEDAIRKLDRIEFGRKGGRLRVEWTKQERGGRKPDSSRKSSGNSRPSKTLFVINFDPINTRTTDIEKHFEQYGRISNVRIRRNFAFVQFDSQEDATRALEAAHLSKLIDRVISVEYAIRDDDKGNGYSPDRRGRDASPDGRGYGRVRSPSPYNRNRGSPDYGHGSVPNSRLERRNSPDYSRGSVPNSRSERRDSRSPGYVHGSVPNSRSERRDSRSPGYVHGSVPNIRSERRDSRSPDYEHGSVPNSRSEQRDSRSPGYLRGSISHSRSERRDSRSPAYEPVSVPNPRSERRDSRSPDYEPGSVRNPRSELRDSRSPDYERAASPASDRNHSPSPPARKRS